MSDTNPSSLLSWEVFGEQYLEQMEAREDTGSALFSHEDDFQELDIGPAQPIAHKKILPVVS